MLQQTKCTTSFEEMFAVALGVPLDTEIDTDLGQPIDEPVVVCEENAPAEETAPLSFADTYRKLWRDYRQDLEQRLAKDSELAAIEREAMLRLDRSGDAMGAFSGPCSYSQEREIREQAEKILERLVWLAEKVFGPAGTRLEISLREVKECFPADPNQGEFDPGAVWEYLEQTYSGQSGEELAWRQVAGELARRFGLNQEDRKVEVKAGAVVLRQHISLDSLDKKYSNQNKLSIYSREAVRELVLPFIGFARWAELNALATDLNHFAQHWWDWGTKVESRKRFELGNEKEVLVVTFNTHFEYRLRMDVAEKLQIFIGTYATYD